MADKASLPGMGNQPPLVQLIFSFIIVVVAGTLLFYLLVFAGSLVFGSTTGEMLSVPDLTNENRDPGMLRFIQIAQQVCMFLLPALLIFFLLRKDSSFSSGLWIFPETLSLGILILLALAIIPVNTWSGMLNSYMDLPDWLSGTETWMKGKEDEASRLTELLTTSSGIVTLTVNVFIMAVIPAFSEEILFRGVFQQLFSRLLRSAHFGILVTAILFSTVHLQFFGFLPRLFLGIVYGYLFYWTGSLWAVIIPHFINNAVPVVVTYFTGWKPVAGHLMKESGPLIMFPVIPFLISILLLYYFWHRSRGQK